MRSVLRVRDEKLATERDWSIRPLLLLYWVTRDADGSFAKNFFTSIKNLSREAISFDWMMIVSSLRLAIAWVNF